MKPLIKWAGGKQDVIKDLLKYLPKNYPEYDYVELFAGSCALGLHLLPNLEAAYFNDINSRLIRMYQMVRTNPTDVYNGLKALEREYMNPYPLSKEEYYYKCREWFNDTADSLEIAVLFLFLNKSCFNGLFRENKKGEFNVPWGKREKLSLPSLDELKAFSEATRGKAFFFNIDYERWFKSRTKRAKNKKVKYFYYLDPPYRPLVGSKNFTAYSRKGFNDENQKLLAQFCQKIHEQGHLFLLSNSVSDDLFFQKLYPNFTVNYITAPRKISANGNRKKVTELLISNY